VAFTVSCTGSGGARILAPAVGRIEQGEPITALDDGERPTLMAKKRHGGLPAYGTWVRLPDGRTGHVTYHNRWEGNIEIALDGKREGTIGVVFGTKLERASAGRRGPRRSCPVPFHDAAPHPARVMGARQGTRCKRPD
jgi:hypothetical protein